MAYKFQLGAAKLGGNLTAADILMADGVISGSIGRFTHLSCSSNSIVIGSTTLSEDELGILDGFADTAIAQAADSIVFFDADTSKLRRDSVSDVMTAVAGDGLGVASSQLKINVDDSGIETNSDTLRLKDGGVTADKMTNLAATNLYVGNGSNRPVAVALSGDVTMDNAGAVTIANDAVSLAKMAGLARGSVIVGDSSGNPSALAKGTAGQIAVSDGDDIIYRSMSGDAQLAANGALTINTDAVENSMIADDAVRTAQIQDSQVTNAKLANSAVTIGSTSVALGASSTVFAGITQLTASHARITELDVVTINSVQQTEQTLEIQDKLIVAALSSSAANATGGGLQIGGGASSAGVAAITWNNTAAALKFKIGATDQLMLKDGAFLPETGNDVDLGSSTNKFKDLYIDGTANIDALTLDGTALTATAAELNVLDGLAQGSILLGDGSGAAAILDASTSGQIMVGDGSTVASVAVSGDATLAANGALTIGTGVVEHAMLAADCIDGDNIQDDVVNSEHIAAGAIDTEHIASNQITKAKMADDAIGSAELDYAAEALATGADHFLFLDGAVDGQLKAESFVDYAAKLALGGFGAGNPGSGLEATSGQLKVDVADLVAVTAIASGDTFAISQEAESGDPSKKITFDNMATKLGGAGLAASAGVLAVNVSGAVVAPVDHVYLSSSIAGTGIGVAPGDVSSGIVTSLEIDIPGLTELTAADIVAADDMMIHDANGGTKKVGVDSLQAFYFGQLSSDITSTGGGVVTIANNAITQAKMADDAIGADELASNAVVNDSVASNAAIAANKLNFNVDLGGDITFGNQSDDTISTAGHFTVGGNFIVNGTTTTVNSTTVQIDDLNLQLGDATGSAAAVNGGGITLGNSGDDFTFAYNHASTAWKSSIDMDLASSKLFKIAGAEVLSAAGAVKVQSAVAGNGLAHSSGVLSVGVDDSSIELDSDAVRVKAAGITAAMLNDDVISGKTALTSGLAATDEFLVSDAGTPKRMDVAVLTAYLASDGLVAGADKLEVSLNTLGASKTSAIDADSLAMIDSAGSNVTKKITVANFKTKMDLLEVEEDPATNLVAGVNFFADFGSDASFSRNLPASPEIGDSVMVKAPSDCGVSKTITIARQGSHTIDGATSIVLESPHAAVQCVYVKANQWRVF
jgi:hypothetical protein